MMSNTNDTMDWAEWDRLSAEMTEADRRRRALGEAIQILLTSEAPADAKLNACDLLVPLSDAAFEDWQRAMAARTALMGPEVRGA